MTTTTIQQKGNFSREWFFYLLLLFTTALSAYLWFSKNHALTEQMEDFEYERLLMGQEASEVFQINAEQQLALMMKPLVWAVRAELTRGNQEQIDQYFKQLVKSDKIQEVTLLDKTGKIILSSNKKNEGNNLDTDYANEVIKIEASTIITETDVLAIASPVMGLDDRLGTLLVVCDNEAFDFGGKMQELNSIYKDIDFIEEDSIDERSIEWEEEGNFDEE